VAHLPRPVRAWICRRLAQRFASTLANALNGLTEGCRIEALLAPNAPDPDLPEIWPAHRRIAVSKIFDDLRRHHAIAIRLASAERLVFALDLPSLPRLRLWTGRGRHAEGDGGSAFVIVPLPPRR